MKKYISIALFLLMSISCLSAAEKRESKQNGHECSREQIESARIAFLTKEVGITTEEAKGFWTVYNDYQKERAEARRDVRSALKELGKMTDEKSHSSDIGYKKAIKSYLEAHKSVHSIEEIYFEEFFKILGPEKVARLIIAEDEFRKEMIQAFRGECPLDNAAGTKDSRK